jgi:hypothetical protein
MIHGLDTAVLVGPQAAAGHAVGCDLLPHWHPLAAHYQHGRLPDIWRLHVHRAERRWDEPLSVLSPGAGMFRKGCQDMVARPCTTVATDCCRSRPRIIPLDGGAVGRRTCNADGSSGCQSRASGRRFRCRRNALRRPGFQGLVLLCLSIAPSRPFFASTTFHPLRALSVAPSVVPAYLPGGRPDSRNTPRARR